jgi:hypothetical protein
MKIGVIGNMNNMYFSLTRYLLDEGFDCEQLIFDYEPEHFHPSCDSYENNFAKYVKKLSWGDPGNFLKQDFDQVRADLKPYDFLIGCGTAPAFVHRINRRLDIFIPYGDDLYSLPFLKIVRPVRMPAYMATAYHQRKGIRQTPYLIFERASPEFEKVFTKLKYKGQRITSALPSIYHKEYEPNKLRRRGLENPLGAQLQQLRAENDLIILQYVRQVWKPIRDKWSLKGNDLLIKGYAAFLKKYPAVTSKLILFEYGVQVNETKQLIKELNIESQIIWLPKMPRKDLVHVIAVSDVVVGELHHSWLTYCVVIETLCMGKPLLHKRNDDELKDTYPDLYPMLNAYSAETVLDGLSRLVENKEEVRNIADESHKWFLDYCVTRPMQEIIRIIKSKANVSLSFLICWIGDCL